PPRANARSAPPPRCAAALGCGRPGGNLHRPHFFEIVEATNLGSEQMNNHVASVNEHPVRLRQTFNSRHDAEFGLHTLHEVIGQSRHMARRVATRNHHHVGDRAFTLQRNGNDIDGLVVVERSENQIMQTSFTRGLTLNATVSGGNRRQPVLPTWWCDHMLLPNPDCALAVPLMTRQHLAVPGRKAQVTRTLSTFSSSGSASAPFEADPKPVPNV